MTDSPRFWVRVGFLRCNLRYLFVPEVTSLLRVFTGHEKARIITMPPSNISASDLYTLYLLARHLYVISHIQNTFSLKSD